MRGKDRTVLPAAKFLDATTFSFDNLDFTFLLACHIYLSSHFINRGYSAKFGRKYSVLSVNTLFGVN